MDVTQIQDRTNTGSQVKGQGYRPVDGFPYTDSQGEVYYGMGVVLVSARSDIFHIYTASGITTTTQSADLGVSPYREANIFLRCDSFGGTGTMSVYYQVKNPLTGDYFNLYTFSISAPITTSLNLASNLGQVNRVYLVPAGSITLSFDIDGVYKT